MGRIVGLIMNQAEQVETFICSDCGKEYKTKDGLEKHIIKEHGEGKED